MTNNQIILYKFIQTNYNVNWFSICFYHILSENFIREFENKVDWRDVYQCIKYYPKTSYLEFQNKVYWDCISRKIKNYQNLLLKNSKIKSIGIEYQNFKNYQKILFVNFKINYVGMVYQ